MKYLISSIGIILSCHAVAIEDNKNTMEMSSIAQKSSLIESAMVVANSSANLTYLVTLKDSEFGSKTCIVKPGERKGMKDFFESLKLLSPPRYFALTVECEKYPSLKHTRDSVESEIFLALMDPEYYNSSLHLSVFGLRAGRTSYLLSNDIEALLNVKDVNHWSEKKVIKSTLSLPRYQIYFQPVSMPSAFEPTSGMIKLVSNILMATEKYYKKFPGHSSTGNDFQRGRRYIFCANVDLIENGYIRTEQATNALKEIYGGDDK